MKNIFLIKNVNLLLVVWFSISAINFTQQPGWIEQDLPASMSGYYYANRGDDVLIFTKSTSDIVYFFDTRINVWTEANLGSQQNFVKVLGAGNTAFAYSDEYIIGYSSILSQWDTIKYQGNVIDPNGVSTYKGYGCANTLAYFVTDANIFYVFDSELAEWQEYNYGMVTNVGPTHTFWAADNYAGAILGRNGYDYYKNIAYSQVTHSFSELDQGGWYYYSDNIMNGGYVASWYDAVSTQMYFGYSATTNEFKSVTFPSSYDVLNFASNISPSSFDLKDIYVYTCGYATGDQINRDYIVKSYSTKTGNWYSLYFSCDPVDCSCPADWRRGGSFSIGHYYCGTDHAVGLWKFYGTTGIHIGEIPDLFATPNNVYVICGGTVAIGIGNHNLWFHNFATEQSKHKYFLPDNEVYFSGSAAAENYCTIYRINNNSDTMEAFFFNGNTNNLQTFEIPKANTTPIATSKVYGTFIGGPNNEVIFYSEEKDSVIIYSFSEQYGSLNAKNYLMVLNWSTSVVFDASTAQIYEKNFQINPVGIGNNIIFAKSGDMELTAYSGITKNWTTQVTDQTLNGYQVGDEIAVGYSLSFAKYWGYSAYDDTYYELVPEGNWVSPSSMAGGKTAIVIRTNKIYAFTPGNVTSVNENTSALVNSFSLSQNYPNPFNPSTTIKWQQPEAGFVTLKIYDVLGREVITLVNKEMSAGKHEVEFDATKFSSGVSAKGRYASGVYFYQLKAGSFIQTKKMILIK